MLFCNLLGKEGDLGGVIASCGELDERYEYVVPETSAKIKFQVIVAMATRTPCHYAEGCMKNCIFGRPFPSSTN